MDKVAQKRGPLTKLREKINVPTEKLMGAFSPQFIELMDQLRDVDDQIREYANDLKQLLKQAKTNYNRREYMSAIAYLGRFYDQIQAIDFELSKLKTAVDVKHHEFLFTDIDPEHIQYLTQMLGPKIKKPIAKLPIKSKASLESTAGLADWWHNLTSDRGRALSAWEKRFPKEAKELKRQTGNLLVKSEALLSNLLSTLATLATQRATRHLEEYLDTAAKFKQKYKAYNDLFTSFYNTYVRKFVELQQQEQEKKEQEQQAQALEQAKVQGLVPQAIPQAQSPIPGTFAPAAPGERPVVEPIAGVHGYAPNPSPRSPDEEQTWHDPREFLIQPHARPWPEEPISPEAEADKQEEQVPNTQKEEQLSLPLEEASQPIKTEIPASKLSQSKALKSKMPARLKQYIKNLKEKNAATFDDEEKTMVSPISTLLHKDKPIEITMIDAESPRQTMPIYPEFEHKDEDEDDERTIVSPISHLLHKERPIEVSIVEPSVKSPTHSHQEFVSHLTILANESPFKMALELMTYAKSLQKEQPEVSQQLVQLSKKLLKGS